ncbi:hypothetical protein MK163_04220, partial [bacterium]|nr:hypothetical protein [bacterium]
DYEQAHAEGAAEVGAVGGYIRFANGVECFSSWEDVGWRGIEIIGTEGMICNSNNTGLGLRLFKSGARSAGVRAVEGVCSEWVDDEGHCAGTGRLFTRRATTRRDERR